MKLVGIYSLADAAQPEMSLAVAGIKHEKRQVNADFAESVHFYVDDTDFDKAADLLEDLDCALNADIDLSAVHACPWCGGSLFAWRREVVSGSEVDRLYCACGGDNPVAIRNPTTKRGGVFERPN
jgi:hypothetical protein